MSVHGFVLVLTASAALLALWLIARFPGLVPRSGRGVSVGLGGAIVCLAGTPPAIMLVGQAVGAIAVVFLVVLPCAIFIFLACAWLMLFVARAIAPYSS